MSISTSKKRIIVATIVLLCMVQILWVYPAFIQNKANIKGVIFIFLISIVFLYFKFEFNKVVKPTITLITMFILPYIMFRNLQRPLASMSVIKPGGIILNVGLLLMAEMVLFLIINRARVTGIIITVVLAFFSVANMFVYYFRGYPIAPTDIHSLKTALGVASNYTLWMNDFIVKNILYLFMFIIIFIQLDFRMKKIKNRLFVIVASMVLVFTSLLTVYQTKQLNLRGFTLNQFLPLEGARENGYFLDFYMNSKGLKVMKPSDYDPESIVTLYEQLKQVDDPVDVKELPNVLIIMNESFADLDALGEITYLDNPLPFFNSLEENTIRGNLVSSVFGGNTPNSEFECMTGSSLAFFPKNAIVYQQFLHTEIPSSVSNLSQLGYYTLAMHPYNKIYWERNRIYPEVLGFDEFVSEENMQNPSRIRDYISDEAAFDLLLERLKTDEEGERIYNFTITMQNHGGYYFGMDEIIAPEINNSYVNEYLSLMKTSDRAFKKFIKELEEFDEPTIICMFGDHQPRLEDSVYDAIWENSDITEKEKEIRKHIVPFVIWANFDIEEEVIPLTSINYLSPMIFQAAGIPQSSFDLYLLALQKKYPSISAVGCFDENYKFYSAGKEMEELLDIQEYERIQYNYIHDEKYRIDEFFEVVE